LRELYFKGSKFRDILYYIGPSNLKSFVKTFTGRDMKDLFPHGDIEALIYVPESRPIGAGLRDGKGSIRWVTGEVV
jgi:hypothetical protein